MHSGEIEELRGLLDLVIEKAGALRAAGVLRLAVDGVFQADLTEPTPTITMATLGADEDSSPLHALDDPLTYGRSEGVPGFSRRTREEPDE